MEASIATPVVDAETEEYWAAVAREELHIPWCAQCGRSFFYPRSFCPRCWSEDVTLRPSSGRGCVYSYTIIRRTGVSPFDAWVPYVLAVIELEDEKVRMLSHVRGIDPAEVSIGMAVAVGFADIGGGRAVPVFSPRGAAAPNERSDPEQLA